MFCHKCGKQLKDNATFCHECGNKMRGVEETKNAPVTTHQNTEGGSGKNYKTRGIIWIVTPILSMAIILSAYAIASFVLAEVSTESSQTIASVINVFLSLLGIVALVFIPIGIIFGIKNLKREDFIHGAAYDERSGKGDHSTVPEEIKKWSWGAAGLGFIWGAYHNVWISLLSFVPVVNYVFWIVMGIKGNEWAWKNNKWISVDDFMRKQKKWNSWGLGITIVMLVLSVLGVFVD